MDTLHGRAYSGLDDSLRWALEETGGEPILAGSAHENLLWDLARAKRKGDARLKPIGFVFLYNPLPELRRDRLNASGRSGEAIQQHLAWDELVNSLCHYIADVSINTAAMSLDEVADVIRTLASLWIRA